MEEKICETTGQKMYKSLCCDTWEYDVTVDGLCEPCFHEIEEAKREQEEIIKSGGHNPEKLKKPMTI